MMQKKYIYIGLGVFAALIAMYWVFFSKGEEAGFEILSEAKKGQFKVEITSSGELQALNSIEILGPIEARRYRIGTSPSKPWSMRER